MKIRLAVAGGTELVAALKRLREAVSRSVLREAMLTAGEPIRSRAASLAPREPGAPDIADHIGISSVRTIQGQRLGPLAAGIAIGPTSDFFYGRFLEMGTAKMRARPYLRPAWDAYGGERALAILSRAIWTELAARGVQRGSVSTPARVSSPGGRTL